MATSSLCNFLSFLSPSSSTHTQTKKPPNQLTPPPLSSDSVPTHQALRTTQRSITPKASFNAMIMVGQDEPEEVLLRRFRREVMKTGLIPEVRRRRYFENSQDEKKRRVRDAAKRNKRRRTPFRPRDDMVKEEVSEPKKDDLDEDNWEISS